MLKLHFDPNLDYQRDAIESVCDLFRGQESCRTDFTITFSGDNRGLGLQQNQFGIGNRLTLFDDDLHSNLKDIQMRNGLAPSEELASGDFTIEMETGTGKTYVYLRTVFELNKRYGFTKFAVVVPSVAIKEGVYKSVQITEDHFRAFYSNTPFDYFIYDSSKLGQVRNFATSPHIQIMIITVGAINKQDVNNLYKNSEKTGGDKPIDLIKATRPILIVDEPQSVDGGLQGRGKAALDAMNPLCTLRYSATHIDTHHMVYRLDAVDAYEKKLVKQIEVASALVSSGNNKPYIKLVSVSTPGKPIKAKLELDVQQGASVVRKVMPVQAGDDLEQLTLRPLYEGLIVNNIGVRPGQEFVELSSLDSPLRLGQSHGGIDEDAVKRQMIHRTIKEHLEKELRLAPQGIKVLSLFFIDAVEHYRSYTSDGSPIKGKYALMFEEEYRKLILNPRYRGLFKEVDLTSSAEAVHNGYFSIDRKKIGDKIIEEFTDTRGNTKADEDTYSLIMKDKERLLSFDTKLKFIFSHSALKEGWDSPNVFQICSLREMGSERERRQTIGRGLRLCVNQLGERLRGFDINTLTVIATESYEEFADNLQKEIESETGIRFGLVDTTLFAGICRLDAQGALVPMGMAKAGEFCEFLKGAGYIDSKGRIQDKLKAALKDKSFVVPVDFKAFGTQLETVIRKYSGKLEIKNADERRDVAVKRAVFDSPDFRALWDRIKYKTTYRVGFDNERLLSLCIDDVRHGPSIPKAQLKWRKAELAIGRSGVIAEGTEESAPVLLSEKDIALPDLVTDLQDKTQLTRASIVRIITESGRLEDFKANPQAYIELLADVIHRSKRKVLVDGIKYQRLGDEYYYAQELFLTEELSGYLKNMLPVAKSLHEYVIYDSPQVERGFAQDLERNEAVKVYAKLPGWFKVPTPLGTYNPDWAVLIEKDGAERLYLVVETKSSLFTDDLRDSEAAKIKCGELHFGALATGDNPASFMKATKLDDVFNKEKFAQIDTYAHTGIWDGDLSAMRGD